MALGFVEKEVVTLLQLSKEILISSLVVNAQLVIKAAAKLHLHPITHGVYRLHQMQQLIAQLHQSSLSKMGQQFQSDTPNCQLLTILL